ncbi:MAG: HIT domain-containing protein, partial [bacterium]
EELASLFSTSKGTIISKTINAKTLLAKALIETNEMIPKKLVKQQDDKECFFIKNNVSEKSKVEKHILKCTPCKNFYNWQLKIDELFEAKPKPKVSSSINKDIFERLAGMAKTLAENIVKENTASGINVLHASGKDAQQSVEHFHLHIIPRYQNDGLDLWFKNNL